jgi:hypothetical protein
MTIVGEATTGAEACGSTSILSPFSAILHFEHPAVTLF